jgi:hypothetical protein
MSTLRSARLTLIPSTLVRRMSISACCVAAFAVPLGCSSGSSTPKAGSDTTNPSSSGSPSSAGADTTVAAKTDSTIPADPCAITTTAITSIGWQVTKNEIVTGPGGAKSQCTFEGTLPDSSVVNGWVAFLPGSQIGFEHHESEAIAGVGATAFRGSPQTGEILVTGHAPYFRIFVSTSDKDAVALAAAVVSGA